MGCSRPAARHQSSPSAGWGGRLRVVGAVHPLQHHRLRTDAPTASYQSYEDEFVKKELGGKCLGLFRYEWMYTDPRIKMGTWQVPI